MGKYGLFRKYVQDGRWVCGVATTNSGVARRFCTPHSPLAMPAPSKACVSAKQKPTAMSSSSKPPAYWLYTLRAFTATMSAPDFPIGLILDGLMSGLLPHNIQSATVCSGRGIRPDTRPTLQPLIPAWPRFRCQCLTFRGDPMASARCIDGSSLASTQLYQPCSHACHGAAMRHGS